MAPRDLIPERLLTGRAKIALTTHVTPDGDGVGAMLGLGLALEKAGKTIYMASQDAVPRRYRYLPHVERIERRLPSDYDALIGLDVSDAGRIGSIFDAHRHGERALIIIDHHATNAGFGTACWIDPGCAATCQMVLELIRELGLPMDVEIATCLLNGIVTDTRAFTTPSTKPDTLEAALFLMKQGADLAEVAKRGLNDRPFRAVGVWGRVLSDARLEDGILVAGVSLEDSERGDGDQGGLDGLSSFLLNVEEARVALFLKGKPGGAVEVSLRSVPGVDVSKAAVRLGGGGHPQASGCTLNGSLDEVAERVVAEVRKDLPPEGPQT